MKKILLIIIITFSFQTLTKSNDIEEFEIEGISLGKSLFKYYSKKEIDNISDNKKVFYPNKDFYDLQLDVANFEIWPVLSFSFKKNDDNLIIHALAGGQFMNIKECNKKKEVIIQDLKNSFFSDLKEEKYDFTYKDIGDGKSIAFISDFFLKNGRLRVYCTDWSKKTSDETGYDDSLRLEIGTTEYFDWLNTKAFN